MKTPSAGTSSVADSTAQAAFHAERNASVSSVLPSPTAPNDRTSNMQESELPSEGGEITVEVSSVGGTEGEPTGDSIV